jgi:tetratricopeptide (TPR) repeat protein
LNNIGLIYKLKKEYRKAIGYYDQALKINNASNNSYETSLNMNAIGASFIELKDYNNGLNFINNSLAIAEKFNYKELIRLNYNALSDIYSHSNQFEKAYDYYKKSVSIKDTLENIEIKKKISEIQVKYETEKKEQEIQILSKQNEIQKLNLSRNKFILVSISVFFIVLLFIGFLLYRQRKIRNESQSVILEQKLLRTQMNPHFIFNSLTSIQSLIFDDDKLALGRYIANFASLMRLILENSREEYIVLEKEITTLKYYLELNQLRFENKFEYTIEVDPDINPEMVYIPPMMGQPFVENSIKHGLAKKEAQGLISIRLKHFGNYLVYEIEDNGIGREKAKELSTSDGNKHVSLAISITRERIENLNKRNKNKITFEVVDLNNNYEASGTLVRFKIPLIH